MLFAPYVRFHIFSLLVWVTEWPPLGKIAAHSAYDMFSQYKYLKSKSKSKSKFILSRVVQTFITLAMNSYLPTTYHYNTFKYKLHC